MDRKVLGRGLDVLIPKKSPAPMEAVGQNKEFAYLPLSSLVPGKYQPRREISSPELEDLRNSIREDGIIQPIVVRKLDSDRYEIVAGGRRYEAAKSLGLAQIPAIIRELDDKNALVFAIVENLQRQDLNPIEEALSFMRLMDEFEFKLDDVARFIGKDKSTISNTLRLLKLPQKIQDALRKNLLNRSQARTILAAPETKQEKLFYRILEIGMTVRELEKSIQKSASGKPKASEPFTQEVEESLQKILGTKVRINANKKHRGKITIEFYNLDDLERLLKKLKQ